MLYIYIIRGAIYIYISINIVLHLSFNIHLSFMSIHRGRSKDRYVSDPTILIVIFFSACLGNPCTMENQIFP